MQGIYKISCIQEPEVYIGSSCNIPQRWYSHKSSLRRGLHPNYKLQDAWDAYGEQSFIWEIIEVTNDLVKVEQSWINKFWPVMYNLSKNAAYPLASEGAIQNMLIARFNKRESYGTGNTLTETQVIEIIKRLNAGELQKDIVKDYNIEVNSISNIKSGVTWSHLNYLVDNEKSDNKEKRKASKEKAFLLFAEGKTPRQVQDAIGRSKATVCRYHQEYLSNSMG